ncbi:MAG TPA: glycosyltransferase family 2 protein [Candidatus Saccharimonadia bacterium]|jgi:dTDP-glucose pyrophosphorylase
MAGRGSRFANVGFKTPKPLIEVDGQPMFLKALSSFGAIEAPKTYTIIIRKSHDTEYGLQERLKRELPEANIVMTDEEPIGAAKDALRSQPHLRDDEGVVIMDCDFWFSSEAYNKMVEEALADKSGVAAGLLTFKSDLPRYSYAETDKDGYVIRTAEKQVISPNAIWGAYFFAHSKTFVAAANKLLAQPLTATMKEYYISPLYNIILSEGKRVKAAPVDKFGSFGTPEELSEYIGHSVQPS